MEGRSEPALLVRRQPKLFQMRLWNRLAAKVRSTRHMNQRPVTAIADPLLMRTLDPLTEQRTPVEILKFSSTKITVSSPVRVFPRTLVQLRNADAFLMGEAQQCLESGGRFEIVIGIEDTYFLPR